MLYVLTNGIGLDTRTGLSRFVTIAVLLLICIGAFRLFHCRQCCRPKRDYRKLTVTVHKAIYGKTV